MKIFPPRAFIYPRLSPDGSRIAVNIYDNDIDIWIWDLTRESLQKSTGGPAAETYPVWRDGRRLIYTSNAAGTTNLYSQIAGGTASPERLTESTNGHFPHSVSPDGKWLVFSENTAVDQRNLMMLALDDPKQIQTLVKTQFREQNGAISPDGRWRAYESYETGDSEIYVRPFPDVNSGLEIISKTGGSQPVWRRDSKELFYWDKSGALTSVEVYQEREWRAGIPKKLLEPRYVRGNLTAAPNYDVSLDGHRFLVIKPVDNPQNNATPMSIVVVQNWFEELKKLTAENR